MPRRDMVCLCMFGLFITVNYDKVWLWGYGITAYAFCRVMACYYGYAITHLVSWTHPSPFLSTTSGDTSLFF